MKKIFTCIITALSLGVFAQNSITAYVLGQGATRTATINNGADLNFTTVADDDALDLKFTFKNNASVTNSYNMKRKIEVQSPTLSMLDAVKPKTYFCFGLYCNGASVDNNDASNKTTLQSGEDSYGTEQVSSIYLEEGHTEGYYIVRYKIYNLDPAKPNDTLGFRVVYNSPNVGIKKITNNLENISGLYPNPATGTSKIYVDLTKDEELKFQVYNSLGGLVYSSNKQKYTAGKNQLVMDSELNSGVYFVTLNNGVSSTTKRLIITK